MGKSPSYMLKTGVVYAAGQIVIQVLNFLLLPIYTNKLGKIEYGKIATVSAYTGFISALIILSIFSGMCRFYNEYDNKNKVVNTALNFSYLVGVFTISILLLFGRVIANSIFNIENSYKIFVMVTITCLLGQVSMIHINKYTMEFKALRATVIEVIKLVLQFSIIIYLVVFRESGIIGIFTGQLISTATIFLYLTIKDIKNYRFEMSKKMLKDMLIFSTGLLPVNASAWILNLSDRYFIDYYKTP